MHFRRVSLAFSIIGLVLLSVTHAQQPGIAFQPVWHGVPLKVDSVHALSGTNDSCSVSRFRMYLGIISLWHKGKSVCTDSGYHLLDLEDPGSWMLPLGFSGKWDEIRFDVGIDSLTNVSGAMGGDLDPTRGMYWTWNSGYINLKLEGTCSASTERGHQFQLHLGGYLPPYPTVQKVKLNRKNHRNQTICIDISRLLASVDWVAAPTIMIPGPGAATLSTVIPEMFYFP